MTLEDTSLETPKRLATNGCRRWNNVGGYSAYNHLYAEPHTAPVIISNSGYTRNLHYFTPVQTHYPTLQFRFPFRLGILSRLPIHPLIRVPVITRSFTVLSLPYFRTFIIFQSSSFTNFSLD
jgi:hypothetical protein